MWEWNNTLSSRSQVEDIQHSSDIELLLKKEGFQLPPETTQTLQEQFAKNPALQSSFEQDIKALQNNPTEKARFELQWIEWYGKVVTLDSGEKMSFQQVLQLPPEERDNILDNRISREDFNAFKQYSNNFKHHQITKTDEQIIKTDEQIVQENKNSIQKMSKRIKQTNKTPKQTNKV